MQPWTPFAGLHELLNYRLCNPESCMYLKIYRNFAEKCKNSANFEIAAVRRGVYLVDLGKCCKMSIWSQKSASIQPRTSCLKIWKWLSADNSQRPLYVVQVKPYDLYSTTTTDSLRRNTSRSETILFEPLEKEQLGLSERFWSMASQRSIFVSVVYQDYDCRILNTTL